METATHDLAPAYFLRRKLKNIMCRTKSATESELSAHPYAACTFVDRIELINPRRSQAYFEMQRNDIKQLFL